MYSMQKLVAALLTTAVGVTYAVPQISIKGPNFVDGNGERIKIVGIDYQPGGQSGFAESKGGDVLADGEACKRDAAVMQQLGINTVRVYNLDQTVNHDECMSIFNEVGIYMILDVNTPEISLFREGTAKSYNTKYMERVFGMIESFKGYPNTLGFFAANEVMNNLGNSKEPVPFIRAVVRDMKQYIAAQVDRPIYVGYSAADVRDILHDTWEYFQCSMSDNDPSQSDFFALNSYSWCGDSSIEEASYDQLQSFFSKSAIPVFFSEYGCNKDPPRQFTEVQAIYGPQMDSLSGGLVYQWTQDSSDFGLVQVNEKDQSIKLLPDFDTLQAEYNKLQTSEIVGGQLVFTSNQAPKCSASIISNAQFSSDFSLPSPPSGVSGWIKSGVPSDSYYPGQLIDVSDTSVSLTVYDSKGNKLNDLALKPVDGNKVNIPGGSSTTDDNGGNAGDDSGSSGDDGESVGARAAILSASGLVTVAAVLFGLF